MKRRKLLALTLLVPALAACSGVSGSGVSKTESRSVSGYDSVEVHGALQVNIEVGPEASLTITGDDNIVPLIQTEVVGDELVIRREGSIRPNTTLRIVVTTPELEGIEVNGASNASVSGIATESFEATAHGASKISLDGKTESLEIDAHGASRVEAEGLKTKHAEVDAAGASRVSLGELEKLDASLSGASRCTYAGDPTIDENLSGASSLSKR